MTDKEVMTVRNNRYISKLYLPVSYLVITMLVLIRASLPVRAQDSFFVYTNPETNYSVYMDDACDLLSSEEEAQLIEEMIPLTQFRTELWKAGGRFYLL